MHNLRRTVSPFLPKAFKKFGKGMLHQAGETKEHLRCTINKYVRKTTFLQKDKLHIGCGDIHLHNFINIDYRATNATDIILNCINLDYFKPKSISLIYSNAFFEHIYRLQRLDALKSYHKVLKEDGFLLFTGIPDFHVIAKAYLSKQKGNVSAIFDLFEVYRLTHGDPEHAPDWWLEQLHKSLFDKETVEELLKEAGFHYYCIFNYCFREENLPVTLGFVAFKGKPTHTDNKKFIKTLIPGINPDVNMNTITISATTI